MKISGGYLFLGVFALIVAASVGFYFIEAYSQGHAKPRPVAVEETPTTTAASATSDTEARPETTTTNEPTKPTSPLPTTTTQLAASTSTSTTFEATATTVVKRPSYLDRYVGRGYRQAYIDIQFFCPSCVPAVARNIQEEPGVIGKSIGWGQKVSWVVYNPKVAKLDRLLELAASSGGAAIVNDTVI